MTNVLSFDALRPLVRQSDHEGPRTALHPTNAFGQFGIFRLLERFTAKLLLVTNLSFSFK